MGKYSQEMLERSEKYYGGDFNLMLEEDQVQRDIAEVKWRMQCLQAKLKALKVQQEKINVKKGKYVQKKRNNTRR